ncbi:hypothetical protein R6Q59_023673 [Mikania micrantha]
MAQSTSSVGQGSNAEVTVVRVLTYSRNMKIWCNWDLVEMSDGSQKARCKYCGMLLAKESNTSLKKHITKLFCKALKNDPEIQQTQISYVCVPGFGPDPTLPGSTGSRSRFMKPVPNRFGFTSKQVPPNPVHFEPGSGLVLNPVCPPLETVV